jgi:hypothetical protein
MLGSEGTGEGCTLAATTEGFDYWLRRPYLSVGVREEAASADILLVPRERFGDQRGPFFPVGTEEFLSFLREHAAGHGLRADICADSAGYRELALNGGEWLVLADLVVRHAALPVLFSLLTKYFAARIWPVRGDDPVEAGITIEQSTEPPHRVVKISYKGPVKGFVSAVDGALKSSGLKGPPQVGDRQRR